MEEAEAATSRAVVTGGEELDPEALGLPGLANLVRTSLDGIAVLDADRRYVYVNPAGCRILGTVLAGRPAPFVPTGGWAEPSLRSRTRAEPRTSSFRRRTATVESWSAWRASST